MQHFLFSAHLPDGREVRVAPVSLDAYEANQAHNLGDDTGYFIYEFDAEQTAGGIEILGKTASYEAALRLADVFAALPGFRQTAGGGTITQP